MCRREATRRATLLASIALVMTLAACGGGSKPATSGVGAAPTPSAGQVAPASAAPKVSFYAASRFAEQATFGPTPALVAELQAKGFERWIDEQLALPASELDMRFVDWNDTQDQRNIFGLFEGEAMHSFVGAPDQLRWRVTWSLSQFVVVSYQKLDPAGVALWANDLHRMALGNYGALLRGLTLSSPMARYLDNDQNRPKGDDCPNCVPNENYARELMQLFSLGVWLLNPDGSAQRDARGRIIETYTQRDVEELARVLTGWRHDQVRVPNTPRNWGSWSRPMVPSAYKPDRDPGRKEVLGRVFPAGQTIYQDLDNVVTLLVAHPNIAPFVATRLIQNLVKSDPSPAYVQRIGAVFRDNGRGQSGDMKAVVKAILLDAEARRGDDPSRALLHDGKLREPVLYSAGLLRALGCRKVPIEYHSGVPWRVGGQPPFAQPSVFGWYAPTDRAPGSNLLAPEQQTLTPRELRRRLGGLEHVAFTAYNPGPSVPTGALSDAGCGLGEFAAAYQRSTSELLALIGRRFMRGEQPQATFAITKEMSRQWQTPNNPQQLERETIQLLEFVLFSEGYGAMP